LGERWIVSLAGGLIVLVSLTAYQNSFDGPFVFDDEPSIPNNPTIQNVLSDWSVLFPPGGGATVSGRPLLNITLAINWAISGDQPRGYHVTNYLIHVCAALLLFGVLRRTFLLPCLRERWNAVALPMALAAAGFWAIHPLQTESVTYVIQRAESLVGLLYLLTLYCFVRSVTAANPMKWHVSSVAACFLGMASKEVMVSAPLIVLLYDRAFVAGSFREAWRRRYGLYLCMMASWLLLAVLVYSTGNRGGTAGLDVGITPWVYLCTQFEAIVHYLRLSVFPYPLVFDYGVGTAKNVVQISACAAVVVALGAATVVALWRWPKVGFLGAWFFAILAPTSSIVPVATQTIAEHRMYLPLAAILVSVAIGVHWSAQWALHHNILSPRSLQIGGVGLVVLLGITFEWLTFQRNWDYGDALTIWEDTVTKQPGSARAHNNYGLQLARVSTIEKATEQFRKAVELDPNYADAQYNLGTVLFQTNQLEEGIEHLRKAVLLNPDLPQTHNNLGAALVRVGMFDEAIEHYIQADRLDPGHPGARKNLEMAQTHRTQCLHALDEQRRKIGEHPKDITMLGSTAWVLATNPNASIRNGTEAVTLAQRAVELSDGSDPIALGTLAAAFAEAKRFDDAAKTAQKAIDLAVEQNKPALAESLRANLELYREGKPVREKTRPAPVPQNSKAAASSSPNQPSK
jgi:Flp pilus assembly protein TadD